MTESEIIELRALVAHCRAHHTRSAVNGRKRAGRNRGLLTPAEQSRLSYTRRKLIAAWDRYRAETETADRLPLADWLTAAFELLPADVQVLRPLDRWLMLAEGW